MANTSIELTYDEKVLLYNKLVAIHADAIRKGATIPYTSVNGHMYSFLTREGDVVIRLSKEERTAFMEKYGTVQPVQYGIVMKEYVTVPEKLLKKTAELKPYFDKSYEYVAALKPKPTKKKSS